MKCSLRSGKCNLLWYLFIISDADYYNWLEHKELQQTRKGKE